MLINTFYKYKSINEFTLDSIKNKYFYYSRQEQLDDPFDMYTPVDTLKTDEEIKELFKRDPETAALHTIDSYKKKQEASEYDEKYHSKFLEATQMFHVFCLTPICDNDAMWALYADKLHELRQSLIKTTPYIEGQDSLFHLSILFYRTKAPALLL